MNRSVETLDDIDLDAVAEIVNATMWEGYINQDFTNITDDEKEAAYLQAFNLVNQGEFETAKKVFEFLCYLDQFGAKFWMGLGICRQQLKMYEPACQAYAMVGMLEMENPMPALRAAECYLALGKIEEADSGLSAALHWAGNKPQYEAVRQRATMLVQALKRRTETH
jgi:type III secretion system low calcium response chaperone LcrH/SycD